MDVLQHIHSTIPAHALLSLLLRQRKGVAATV